MDFLEIHCSVKYVHVKKRRFAEVKDSETQTLSVTFEMRFEMVKKKLRVIFIINGDIALKCNTATSHKKSSWFKR